MTPRFITTVTASISILACSTAYSDDAAPTIVKSGTIDFGMVETAPVVFQDRLYRFEAIRPTYHNNSTGNSYFRLIDHQTGNVTPNFAVGHDLGSVYVENGKAHVFGTPSWGASSINLFTSTDLTNWQQSQAISLPGWELFNTSVAKDANGYVMAMEVGAPSSITGVRFTNRFATSTDLQNWSLLPEPAVYSKTKYSAAPTIRWHDDYYYLTYLNQLPDFQYATNITRSTDLINWEESPNSPVLMFGDEDRVIANATISQTHRDIMDNTVNSNNSDLDYIEFDGQVILNYSWGDQTRNMFLAEARFDGSLEEFYASFFPSNVPEPGSLSALSLCAGLMLARRRRRNL